MPFVIPLLCAAGVGIGVAAFADRSETLSFRAASGRATDALSIARRHGFDVARVNRLGIVDVHTGELPAPEAARRFALDPQVAWAEVARAGEWLISDTDPPLPDDPMFEDQWHLENTGQEGGTPGADIGARDAWRISKGDSGVVIAALDSGVELEHIDLVGSAWRNSDEIENGIDDDQNGFIDDLWGWDFANDNNDPRPTLSDHGTLVAGTIVARGSNGEGVAGIAGGWGGEGGVRLMALQIGENQPLSEVLDDAIIYAIDMGADIITMSLRVSPSQAIDEAVAEARRAGVLLVAAAGNTGGEVGYPASLPDAVAVSGTTRDDLLWSSSARGAEIELAAPADEIWTTDKGGGYDNVSGTSFAAPLVAGAAGLVASASPFLPVRDDLLLSLASGATDLGAPGRDEEFGWGRIDARGAIDVRNELIGHVFGSVHLPRGDWALARSVRVEAADLGFEVLVDEADQSYSLPLPGGEEHMIIASAWGLGADTAWASVAPGGITDLDLEPVVLPVGGIEGTLADEEGRDTAGLLRFVPEMAHGSVLSDGSFEVGGLPQDSMIVIQARGVLRGSAPESLVVQGGDTVSVALVLSPSQDFDQVDGGMEVQGGVWAHGVGPSSNSAPAVWGAPLLGGYPNDADASLISPPLLVEGAGAEVSFFHQMAAEDGFDGGNLGVSVEDDTSWSVVVPSGGYPHASFPNGNGALRGEPGWTGAIDWRRVVVPLGEFEGEKIRLRWHLGSDGSLAGEGWWIDDLVLHGGLVPVLDVDLEPSAVLGARPGDSVEATVSATNRSGSTIDARLRIVLDGVPHLELPFGTLAEGESRSVSITRGIPPMAPGLHGVAVEIVAGGGAFDAAGMVLELRP
ncbi:MAG: hypothetical protein CME06_01975 [Gemmatimonadetes bacterium]|nr:hypothetical protein [Gemmatimonadota bacterium]